MTDAQLSLHSLRVVGMTVSGLIAIALTAVSSLPLFQVGRGLFECYSLEPMTLAAIFVLPFLGIQAMVLAFVFAASGITARRSARVVTWILLAGVILVTGAEFLFGSFAVLVMDDHGQLGDALTWVSALALTVIPALALTVGTIVAGMHSRRSGRSRLATALRATAVSAAITLALTLGAVGLNALRC